MENNNKPASVPVYSLGRVTVNTAAETKPKTTRKGAGRKTAKVASHFAGVAMALFVTEIFKMGKTRLELIATSASMGRVPVAGPLADGSYEVTRAGMVTLSVRDGKPDARHFIGSLEHVKNTWEAIEGAIVPTIGGTSDKVASEDSIDPLSLLDNMIDDSDAESEDETEADQDAALPEAD